MEGVPTVTNSELARLLRPWRRDGGGYMALAGAMRSLILDGRLPLRARLPSERSLAAAIGVSRTTSTAAYAVLRDEGYLETLRGSGSRIVLPTGGTVDREVEGAGEPTSNSIDLTIAAMPAPGAMLEAVARASRDLAAHLGGFGYDPLGIPSFRRAVAEHFTRRGVPTTDEQIVVTSGAQNALRLLGEVLVAPSDPVLVEIPSYPHALEALRRAGGRLIPVDIGDDGWDMDLIAARFRQAVPRLAYMVCDFQNPTGFLMDDGQRSALVVAAGRAGAHVIVDETFTELDLEPWRVRPQPMAVHDPEARVIAIGSMSKAYWGGLRIGWIRCVPPLARRVARARAAIDLATPVFEQLVAEHLLRASESVISERRTLLRARRDALANAVRAQLPAWRFRVPSGGLCLWPEMDRPDAEALADVAETEGVRVSPGSRFTLEGSLDRRVRLPYTLPEDLLQEAVARLATANRRLELGARPRTPSMVT
jgi:DNA-binding transcriptional MocR family regulator